MNDHKSRTTHTDAQEVKSLFYISTKSETHRKEVIIPNNYEDNE